MMKKILLILMMPMILFAQEEQGIELPDFVITGVKKVSVPKAKKEKARLFSTLSKEFFTPVKSPEEFELFNISAPKSLDTNNMVKSTKYKSNLFLGAGLNTLPIGQFNYSLNSEHFLFGGEVFGFDEREYEDYAGYNVSGADAEFDFFISSKSNFLPSSIIGVDASYWRDEYNFYGSAVPTNKRKTQNGDIKLSFKNNFHENIRLSFDFGGSTTDSELDADLSENVLSAGTHIEFGLKDYKIVGTGRMETQKVETSFFKQVESTFSELKAGVSLSPIENLKAEGGIYYSKFENDDLFSPYAFVSLKLMNGLSVFAELDPYTNFMTVRDLLNKNMYLNFNTSYFAYEHSKVNLKAAVQYQYYEYIELTGGFSIEELDNFAYFNFNALKGNLDLYKADDVERNKLFLNMLFHLGPYGKFYGEVIYNDVKFGNGNEVPQIAEFETILNYGYNFDFGLDLNTKLSYFNGINPIATSNGELDNYVNLELDLSYYITESLSAELLLSNILNNDNYRIANYLEKPFDAVVGINYRW